MLIVYRYTVFSGRGFLAVIDSVIANTCVAISVGAARSLSFKNRNVETY